MIRHTALVLAMLAMVGCGRRQEAERLSELPETNVPVAPRPPARKPEAPFDGPYLVVSDVDEGPVRRTVDVRLNGKIPAEDLQKIALELKAREKRPHERTVIFYYLPAAFPELDGQPWASTHFLPDLKVEIIGLSRQEEEEMRGMRLDHQGKRIGAWLQDNQYKTLDLIFEEDGAVKLVEIRSPTDRVESELIEMPSNDGRRFKKVNGSNLYDVDQEGNLRISNAGGTVFSAARPIR